MTPHLVVLVGWSLMAQALPSPDPGRLDDASIQADATYPSALSHQVWEFAMPSEQPLGATAHDDVVYPVAAAAAAGAPGILKEVVAGHPLGQDARDDAVYPVGIARDAAPGSDTEPAGAVAACPSCGECEGA